MKKSYRIPKGSRYVTVEVEEGRVVTVFEPEDTSAFISDITDALEHLPDAGDLAIFWKDGNFGSAIISTVEDIQFDEAGCLFKARNGAWYNCAVRFRSVEQYGKIAASHGG